MSVVVWDCIMGGGKTERIKEYMVKEDRPILYITPLLSEVLSVVGAINDGDDNHMVDDSGCFMYDINNPVSAKSFRVPNCRNQYGSKLEGIRRLVSCGANISSTHSLFSLFDAQLIKDIKDKGYVLIVDESLNVWSNFSLQSVVGLKDLRRVQKAVEVFDNGGSGKEDADVLNLIKQGVIVVDPVGLLHWQSDVLDMPDGTILGVLRKLCDMKQLYLSNGKVVFWELNTVVLDAFSDIIIGTYMFEYSYMAHYLRLHGVGYSIERFGNKPSFYKDKINIIDDRLNDVGDGVYSLSYSDLCVKRKTKSEKREVLRKNLNTFLSYRLKSKKGERIWTTFVDASSVVANGSKYKSDWIAYNTKATNKYRHIENVAYLCNNFPNTYLVSMLNSRGSIKFDQDAWALQDFLQFIFRSRIRMNDGSDNSINLYVPSSRMRNLLIRWLNDEFEA